MRVIIAIAVTTLATGAGAACNLDDAGLSERHTTLAAERGELTLDTRASLAVLRRAAETLDLNGHQTSCEQVVDTAARMLEDEGAWVAEPAVPALDKLNLETFAGKDQPVESRALIGQPVAAPDGTVLGLIDGVLLDQGRDASHLILRFGDVWTSGAEIALPTTRLIVEPETRALYAEISPASLTEAPRYDRAAWDADANDEWYHAEAAKAVDQSQGQALMVRSAEQKAYDQAIAASIPAESEPEGTSDVPMAAGGPKRIRVEKDRPDAAQGSSD